MICRSSQISGARTMFPVTEWEMQFGFRYLSPESSHKLIATASLEPSATLICGRSRDAAVAVWVQECSFDDGNKRFRSGGSYHGLDNVWRCSITCRTLEDGINQI